MLMVTGIANTLDLYTPEFADSFVIWRTDSSHVSTRLVRGVDFVLYNSHYVIRVYDGSSYGYVGYIVGNECRLYWSDLSLYDTDSLISSISSKVSSISSKVDSLATNITQLMASNGYLASINNCNTIPRSCASARRCICVTVLFPIRYPPKTRRGHPNGCPLRVSRCTW